MEVVYLSTILLIDGLHFDMTVTLGNVLTILAFSMAAMAFGFRLDNKVEAHDVWIKGHSECARRQLEILDELREALAFIRGRMGLTPGSHEHRREGDD